MRVVLAGAGLAAQRCAEALRAAGHDGPIAMIGAERHFPYDRPPLSKPGPARATPLRPERWYADHDVELRLGVRVSGLRGGERRIALAGGGSLRYDRLLIATGAEPVVPGLFADAHNVQTLRTVEDAARLRTALVPGCRLAVVGAGLVGQEVASMAAGAGVEVTLVDAAATPFDRLLGPALGAWLAALHRAAGVGVRVGVRVTGVAGRGRVEALELDDGGRVACDHVVVGVGVRPATSWAGAGATALPGVFAAGDAAGAGHWEKAARQGAACARAMLGLAARPEPPAVLWSDQHGVRLQRLGDPHGADRSVVDGDPARHSFTLTYERRGRPIAAVTVGRPGALPALRRRLLAAAAQREGMAA